MEKSPSPLSWRVASLCSLQLTYIQLVTTNYVPCFGLPKYLYLLGVLCDGGNAVVFGIRRLTVLLQ
eukprot:scaffold38305_cov62-Cyclotella_meneghiniana.AAC.3